MKNQNKDKIKKLSEFCKEYGFDEDQVRKENDDIIIIASGEEFIDEEIFFNQLPQLHQLQLHHQLLLRH